MPGILLLKNPGTCSQCACEWIKSAQLLFQGRTLYVLQGIANWELERGSGSEMGVSLSALLCFWTLLVLKIFPLSQFISCNNSMLEDLRSVRRLERDFCALCKRAATVFKVNFFNLFRTWSFCSKASFANWRHLVKIWTRKVGGKEGMALC